MSASTTTRQPSTAAPANRLAALLPYAAPVTTATANHTDAPSFAPPAQSCEPRGDAGQPDPAAVAIAARQILNHVAAATLQLASPSTGQPDPVSSAVSMPELLRCFLSDNERTILKALAVVPAGRRITGSEVQAETGIKNCVFWTVWAELQVRGLIVQTGHSRAASYRLGFEWLRILLS